MRAPLSTCKSSYEEKQHRTNSASCKESEELSAFGEDSLLVEYALRLIQTYGNELCSALGGWLKSASFVCVAVSAV